MNFSDREVVNALLRNDFLSFLRRVVSVLNPGAPLLLNWHLEALAYYLGLVRQGRITRLIINMPPRYLKSITVSVAFPAFLLGQDPRRRIFGISYGTELAIKHASDFRSVVESPWYRRAFPQMRISRSTEAEIATTRRGYRKATSVHAAITGLGGDTFIIDDPLKPIDALSDVQRTRVNDWFFNTLKSRLDNKATGTIIVVMQRVHLNDLTGFLTDRSDDWVVLSLPAIAEADEKVLIGDNRYHFRRAGEALHPEQEPLSLLEKQRVDMGSEVFSAQYQQAPVPPGGGMIKRKWLRYYDDLPDRRWPATVIQSWDTAAKTSAQNDWSVCTTWLKVDKHFYLMDVTRGRYEYPQLRATAIALAEKYKPDTILIEDASTGVALVQELRQAGMYVIDPIPVERDKLTRLYLQQAKFEAGFVHFPRSAHFMPDLEAELLVFPQGKTDDQVDSISQALAYNPYGGYDVTMRWVRGE